MKIAVTGATGFIGRYIVDQLLAAGHQLRCWHRSAVDDRWAAAVEPNVTWVQGQLNDDRSTRELVQGCDAVVHAALWHTGRSFRADNSDWLQFVDTNVMGSLRLIQAAIDAQASRFVFISTCAVHEVIWDDRPLDETHPTWSTTHYGAHKAAIEQFVYSLGLSGRFNICALRPTGVYGIAHPVHHSKWFELVRDVVDGREVSVSGGGKEVHAADVAHAVTLLLQADDVAGKVFNCFDRYVSQWEVAHVARRLSGSSSTIHGDPASPKHQIDTQRIRSQGMEFGGTPLLERVIGQLIAAVRETPVGT